MFFSNVGTMRAIEDPGELSGIPLFLAVSVL